MRSVDLQLDAMACQPRRIRRQRDLRRRAQRCAGAHVEAPLVVRAFDLVALEKTVAQARVAVRAAVRGGVDAAGDEVDRDLLAGDVDLDRVAGGEIVEGGDRYPGTRAHGASLISDR